LFHSSQGREQEAESSCKAVEIHSLLEAASGTVLREISLDFMGNNFLELRTSQMFHILDMRLLLQNGFS
jgi:hypothetical protein